MTLFVQFSIFEPRDDGKELNFGESFGDITLGFFNSQTGGFEEIDPKIGYIAMDLIRFDGKKYQ